MGAALPTTLAVPAFVSWCGVEYAVAAIGAGAFSSCEAEAVELPASISSVDPRALRVPSLQRVEVDPASPSYASYDGVLYDAGLTCLLSISGGRQGAVRILSHAEAVEPGALSHGALVDSFSVDSR